MIVTVPKKTLVSLLSRVTPVADRKSPMPQLANVLLSAEGSTLTAVATDLYISARGTEPVDVEEPGALAVPAGDLLVRAKNMPDGNITLTAGADFQLIMKAAGSPRRYTIAGIDSAEMPKIPDVPEGEGIVIEAKALLGLIKSTDFSISSDETRANVNSLLIKIGAGQIVAVSTDGHRLSKAVHVADGIQSIPDILLRQKACGIVRRLLDESSGNVELRTDSRDAFFTIGTFTFNAKMVDAQFPPYEQVIPAMSDHVVTLPRARLMEAMKAVSISAAADTNGVKCTFDAEKLTIVAESAAAGNAMDEVPCDGMRAGSKIVIGFAAKYMLDVLSALDGDEVKLGVSGGLDPIVVKPAAGEFVGVVMPCRI